MGLQALGSRLALYAAGCLVSSIPNEGHLKAGERITPGWNRTSLGSSHLQQQAKRDTLLPEDTGSASSMSCIPLRGDLVMIYEAL